MNHSALRAEGRCCAKVVSTPGAQAQAGAAIQFSPVAEGKGSEENRRCRRDKPDTLELRSPVGWVPFKQKEGGREVFEMEAVHPENDGHDCDEEREDREVSP